MYKSIGTCVAFAALIVVACYYLGSTYVHCLDDLSHVSFPKALTGLLALVAIVACSWPTLRPAAVWLAVSGATTLAVAAVRAVNAFSYWGEYWALPHAYFENVFFGSFAVIVLFGIAACMSRANRIAYFATAIVYSAVLVFSVLIWGEIIAAI